MKTTKLMVMIAAIVFAACSQAPQSNSSVRDASESDPETPVAAAMAPSLPGKPQAVGFRIVDETSTTLNVLVRIAPGAPVLRLSAWTGKNDPTTITINRQDPCKTRPSGWLCSYLSDDGQYGFTVHYLATAPDTFRIQDAIRDGVTVPDGEIMPPPNPSNGSDSGCDPTNPMTCPWF